MAFVFISYSHADKEFAMGFAQRLHRAGVEHFLDDDSIGWGQDIPEEVHRAIERATHLVVLISPGSEQSQWVAYEMGYARGRRISLVPYLLHPSMRVPGFIASRRYMRSPDDEERFIAELKVQLPNDDPHRRRQVADAARRLMSPNSKFRMEALEYLVKNRAIKELIAGLDSPRPEVRTVAAFACAKLRAPEALPYLVAGLRCAGRNPMYPIIPQAEEALKSYGSQAFGNILQNIDEGPLSSMEKNRFAIAIANTIYQSALPQILSRCARQKWLIKSLLLAPIDVSATDLIPHLQECVKPRKDSLLHSKEPLHSHNVLAVIRWLEKSNLRNSPEIKALVGQWAEVICMTANTAYKGLWDEISIAQSAFTLGAVSIDNIRNFAQRTPNKILQKNLQELALDPKGFKPEGVGSLMANLFDDDDLRESD